MENTPEPSLKDKNPRQFLEEMIGELEVLAIFARAMHKNPVVVLIDGSSPWATGTKRLLAEIDIHPNPISSNPFLKGCGDWTVCEIAAKSAPALAQFILDPPTNPNRVKIVMFHQTTEGLRIACSDILPDEPRWH